MNSSNIVVTALLLAVLCLLSSVALNHEKKLAFYEGRQSVFKALNSPNCVNLLGCLTEEYTR